MRKTSQRLISRIKRKQRIRKSITGNKERPRLSVFRSSKNIYAQIIDDSISCTLVSASTLDMEFKEKAVQGKKVDVAKVIGSLVGKRALEKGITKVVFDRNGFLYHGRIKALSDGAREAGLHF